MERNLVSLSTNQTIDDSKFRNHEKIFAGPRDFDGNVIFHLNNLTAADLDSKMCRNFLDTSYSMKSLKVRFRFTNSSKNTYSVMK